MAAATHACANAWDMDVCYAKAWDVHTWECSGTLAGHSGTVSGLAVCGVRLVSASFDKTLVVWEPGSATVVRRLLGHTAAVNCVAAIRDDRVVSGGDDNVLLVGVRRRVNCHVPALTNNAGQVWSLSGGQRLAKLCGHTDYVSCVMVLGSFLLSGAMDKKIKLWGGATVLSSATTPSSRPMVADESSAFYESDEDYE